MFCTYFTDKEVYDYPSAKMSDTETFGRFFRGLIDRGINVAPSQFEAGFMSLAHSPKDIEKTISAAFDALREIKK